jgi:hypothetical protein
MTAKTGTCSKRSRVATGQSSTRLAMIYQHATNANVPERSPWRQACEGRPARARPQAARSKRDRPEQASDLCTK